jgi:hypothetical protein
VSDQVPDPQEGVSLPGYRCDFNQLSMLIPIMTEHRRFIYSYRVMDPSPSSPGLEGTAFVKQQTGFRARGLESTESDSVKSKFPPWDQTHHKCPKEMV